MKKNVGLCLVLLLALAGGGVALGDFSSYANFNALTGEAWGSASGEDALVTSIQTSIDYWLNPEDRTARIFASSTVEGVWGDPQSQNPYYDFVQRHGLSARASLQLTRVYWNGEWYEFQDRVELNNSTHASLWRDDERTRMSGYMDSSGRGLNVVPLDAAVNVQIFDPGHPSWLPDWQVQMSSSWWVTSDYQLATPEPTSLAVIVLGAVTSGLRRRR